KIRSRLFMPEPDSSAALTASRKSLARNAATRYKERYSWADQDSVLIMLGLGNTFSGLMAALNRCFDGAGMTRRGSRTTVLRLLLFAPSNQMTQTEIGRDM